MDILTAWTELYPCITFPNIVTAIALKIGQCHCVWDICIFQKYLQNHWMEHLGIFFSKILITDFSKHHPFQLKYVSVWQIDSTFKENFLLQWKFCPDSDIFFLSPISNLKSYFPCWPQFLRNLIMYAYAENCIWCSISLEIYCFMAVKSSSIWPYSAFEKNLYDGIAIVIHLLKYGGHDRIISVDLKKANILIG